MLATLSTKQSLSQGLGIEVFSGLGIGILKSTNVNLYTSNRIGIQLGVLGSVQLRNALFFESGLILSPKGGFLVTPSSRINTLFNYPNYSEIILNYIDIPLLFSANSERIRIYAGPQISLMTKAKLDGDNSGSNYQDIKSYFYGTDIGLRLGIGLASKVGVSGRIDYSLGFKDINKDPNEIWRTNTIQISIGYKYLNYTAIQGLKNGSQKNSGNKFPPIHREF